jgi:hypothetical protein
MWHPACLSCLISASMHTQWPCVSVQYSLYTVELKLETHWSIHLPWCRVAVTKPMLCRELLYKRMHQCASATWAALTRRF